MVDVLEQIFVQKIVLVSCLLSGSILSIFFAQNSWSKNRGCKPLQTERPGAVRLGAPKALAGEILVKTPIALCSYSLSALKTKKLP